jgi:hypothetical protein
MGLNGEKTRQEQQWTMDEIVFGYLIAGCDLLDIWSRSEVREFWSFPSWTSLGLNALHA